MAVLVLFLTAAAIAAYMATSLLMPASPTPAPRQRFPRNPPASAHPRARTASPSSGTTPGTKAVTKYRIVRTMLQDGRPVMTPITVRRTPPPAWRSGDPIAARDPDGSSLTYTLEGTDAAAFEVIKDTNNKAQLKTKDALNHEEKAEYDLTIKVRDGRKSATHALAVSVTAPSATRMTHLHQLAVGPGEQPGRGLHRHHRGPREPHTPPSKRTWASTSGTTVSYTDNPAGAGQQAMAATDNPVDEQITLDKESYTFHTFENSIAALQS